MTKLFSYKNRPPHLGPYPLERLRRTETAPDLSSMPPQQQVTFTADDPVSVINAMGEYQAMMDVIRDGTVKAEMATIPSDPQERANHLKAFGYYCDASMVGTTRITSDLWLKTPFSNPDVDRLSDTLRTKQVKTLASGIDMIMAGLREAMAAPPTTCDHHTNAIAFLYEYPRDPKPDEKGSDWIKDAQTHRAALRASETTSVLAAYIRSLGYDARAHSASATDIDLARCSVAAGLAQNLDGVASNPILGTRFGLSVITTTLEITPDQPLAADQPPLYSYKFGTGKHAKSARTRDPFAKRDFADGPHPYEKLKKVDDPTTYIDAPNVARVPKRADMFARSLFGDLGKSTQEAAKNGNYARKSAAAFAFRHALGAFVLLQDGGKADEIHPSVSDADRNAANLKATAYFLGCDAVGLSACPDWCYYSHDATGAELTPYHSNAISIVIDQGHETMEGASGDDWIACAQSMRAYLRFSLLGGVLGQQIRNMGYTANVHTVMGSEVVQPPLMLLSGLGEVSRIGEVILNPFLGPRLKSGTVTTNMPMTHDKPIDFGLQKFCESCNKCARECPSGAITAGPKLMFNGYEIWKSDSQKCTTYRITTAGGAMCGRCMKTCPWNLEGLFSEAPFRWAASNLPFAAKALAKLDDMAGNGSINPVKKWWWDLEMVDDGPYTTPQKPVSARDLSLNLDLKFEDQTLAVYPANLLPPPYPWPFPMDREAAIKAYHDMIPASEHKRRRAAGQPPEHTYSFDDTADKPVMRVQVSKVEKLSDLVTLYEFSNPDGSPLPPSTAGAHIDVVVAPEFFRQYSMSHDPADPSKYQIAVLREDGGRGGSKLMARSFEQGRMVFISKPLNHFPLIENASKSYLMGGGIGITPMVAMAHRLHAIGADFELHYSASRADQAAFDTILRNQPWSNRVSLHYSDQGSRADLAHILQFKDGAHVYTCGPDAYMASVLDTATANGFPEDNRHMEYFSVPEQPEYENHAFTLKLAKSGRSFDIPADKSPTDVLQEAGVQIDVKCSDGICGVCKCGIISGEVEHRDFVLSNKQRETALILCQSRAAKANGVLEIDL
ncbi:reductive dehalogenase [Amylibacter sp. IMCC11727]|uniref:reductive dehalogenase n=1 Tax=Amylibacter sp. IMCC11727 TaxID=3039851 RepID=UPI00244DE115|nr:reductive dehalogenase [Amylibacter sp. IMCC11727]WGI20980.1 reductive dehalogenase [Amylibacter sp. IMCC11727]